MRSQHNNAFLVIDTYSLIASRYVDGKFTGEQTKIDPNSDDNYDRYKANIDYFRLVGWE